MRAFVVNQYKEPLQDHVSEPVVGEHDVLVRVDAAGLNQLDEKIRAGEFKQILPYKLPLLLGNDVAGTVIRVGATVRGFKPGDEVYARPDKDRVGTFAERIAVAEADLALKPASISIEEAASLPLVALIAWQALVERGNVQPGQKGPHPCRRRRGRVDREPARQAPRRDHRHTASADTAIDYRAQDFEQLLDGYDLVLDSLGGKNLEKSLRVLRPGGKATGISGPPDPPFAQAIGLNPRLRLAITGLSAVRRGSSASRTSSCSCAPAATSSARSRPSSTPARCAPWSERCSPSTRPPGIEGARKGGMRGKAVIGNT